MYSHTSVEKTAEKFYDELRRKVYITPKSYLDSIKAYRKSLEDK
jgi:dynein heavy chain